MSFSINVICLHLEFSRTIDAFQHMETLGTALFNVRILRAGVQPTLDPYAEAFAAGPLR